jgi:hypothetical protein
MVDSEIEARGLLGKGFLNVLAFHRFSPAIDFYGEGPRSSVNNRTAYSLEENSLQLVGGWELERRMRLGTIARYLRPNVGRTRNARLVPTEDFFDASEVPGLREQVPFLEIGGFVELLPSQGLGGPPGGTRASVRVSRYSPRQPGHAGFTRMEAEVERNQLFLNQQKSVLLRGRTVLSALARSAQVPFYLQPQLGGQQELRGFQARRFYDNNLVSATAEYQWQIFSNVRLAVFTDVGKVFTDWDRWSLQRLETSFGGGARFGEGSFTTGRFDVAVSREGVKLWVVFGAF